MQEEALQTAVCIADVETQQQPPRFRMLGRVAASCMVFLSVTFFISLSFMITCLTTKARMCLL